MTSVRARLRLVIGLAACVALGGTLFAAAAASAALTRIDGIKFRVLLPPSYGQADARWPVLYVIPGSGVGADEVVPALRLRRYANRDQAIIVTASEDDPIDENYFVDYLHGTKQLDTAFTQKVIPWVDSHYDTLATGAHRGIVGFSTGGYSSAAVASRHPGMFNAVGSFSGVVDINDESAPGVYAVMPPLLLDRGPGAFDIWGDPIVNHANFVAQNPTSLAPRLRGTGLVYLSAGSGLPQNGREVGQNVPGFPIQMYAEATVSQMNRHYDRALTAAGVAHVYRQHPGIHATPHWRDDLADFWPQALAVIGH